MHLHPPIRIERIGAGDRSDLLALLIRLDDCDRHSRFMVGMTDSSLAAYVDAINFGATVTYGARGEDGTLLAVAEGFTFDESGRRWLELAFATDPAWRRRGLARLLFDAVAEQAERDGLHGIVARCTARNGAMRSLMRATHASTDADRDEVSASWPLAGPRASQLPSVGLRGVCMDTSSAWSFRRSVDVSEHQTARCLFATLPFGAAYAARMIPAMATGALVATIESLCILELQSHIDDDETVVGTEVDVQHLAPAVPGRALRISGAGRRDIGNRVLFDVVVEDDTERVATARVELAIVDTARLANRLAGKVATRVCSSAERHVRADPRQRVGTGAVLVQPALTGTAHHGGERVAG